MPSYREQHIPTADELLDLILKEARRIHTTVVTTDPLHHVDETMLICTFMDTISPALTSYRAALREQHKQTASPISKKR